MIIARSKLTLFTIAFFIFSYAVNAQSPPLYYSDTLTPSFPYKALNVQSKGAAFYMYAITKSATGSYINAVTKTDTSGQLKWTAYPNNYALHDSLQFNGNKDNFQLLTTSTDNAVYLLNTSDSPFYYNSGGSVVYLSKIDDSTGDVKWMQKITDYGLNIFYVHATDYSPAELLLSSFRGNNLYSIVRVSKADGHTIQTINYPVGPNNFDNFYGQASGGRQLYISTNGNIYILGSDTCYKYSSLDNTSFEWKKKYGTSYADIKSIFEDNGIVYVAGSKVANGYIGLITAFNIAGTVKWQHQYFMSTPTSVNNIEFCEAEIKGDHLYSTWKHRFVGSISEKTYINCTAISTGNTIWQNNYNFNSDTTTGNAEQAMVSMEVDDNERLYLTGYVPNPTSQQYDWGFMKINGLNGTILTKRRMQKLSSAYASNDAGQYIKRYNGQLYSVGYRAQSTALYDYAINLTRLDTTSLQVSGIKKVTALFQYHSTVQGTADFSLDKKLVVKNVGRRLELEMTDNNFTTIWTKTLGDNTNFYQGTAAVGVGINNRIYLAAKRYLPISQSYWMLNEFHDHSVENYKNDSVFVFELDSNANLIKTYRYYDNKIITPLRFVADSASTKTFFEYFYKANSTYQSAFVHYSFTAADGTWGSTQPINDGRVPMLKMRNSYHLANDTLIGFKTGNFNVNQVVKFRLVPSANIYYTTFYKTKVIYDVEKASNHLFYIVGQDSLQKDFIMAFNSNNNSQPWRNTFDTLQNTVKVLLMDSSLYTLMKRGRTYFVEKYKTADGSMEWSFPVTTPANHVFTANDFVVNKIQKTITVAGSINDSTGILHHSLAYAYTFDQSGAVYYKLMADGSKTWLNEASVLYVDRNGRTLTGGRTAVDQLGYAGFLMDADKLSGYVTQNDGNWNDPATWASGIVPPSYANVIIRNNVTVTANATCNSILIQAPGSVTVNTGVLFTVLH